ncbi:hypothetical protein OFC87_29045, partial [Escherichia coli]|nr:hypothetical protein [Escherichia coli]
MSWWSTRFRELELMGVVRVPYLLAELKERGCADES